MSDIDTNTGVFVEADDLRVLERMGLLAPDDDGGYHAGERFETLMPILRAVDGARTVDERDRLYPDSGGIDPPPGRTDDGSDPTDAELVSLVAHDLRGPLSQASGWLALAREDGDEECFDGVEDALERMAERVEDLVRLANDRSDSAATESVSLSEVADRVWDELVADAMTGEGTLVVESDGSLLVVPDRLERLLANLFRNALVHGRDAGESDADATDDGSRPDGAPETNGGRALTIRIGRLADGFYVEDDGTGIAAEELDRVFAAGYTTDGSGSGLGLASVAQVAAAHGWRVDLTAGEAGGARFEFSDVATPS